MAETKRIAKNTLVLYFRMFITMVVGLYMARVVLSALGEIDYGIYGVVATFVTSFGIISGAMATATQRFLSFEIGKTEDSNVKAVFSTAIVIHLRLAAVVLVVGEIIGVWFLNFHMNFPPERYEAANWVFQLSLLTFVVNIYSVPYNAALVAYEKMTAFAYVAILEVVLKLIVAIVISYSDGDRLILYAILIAAIAVVVRIIYGIYVKTHMPECRCTWRLNKSYSKEMTSFVGWNLVGSLANTAKDQGVNIVLNLFFGAAVNSARAIAYQVMGAISAFATNFQMALNPQIIKSYAAGETDDMFKLVFRGSKFSYMLLLMLSLPVIIEAEYILDLWLVDVPEHTVMFLRLVLCTVLIDSLSNALVTAMHASGKVRDYQIVVGGISLLTLPTVYVALSMGNSPEWALAIGLAFAIVCHVARLIMLRISIDLDIAEFICKVTLRVGATTIVAAIAPTLLYMSCDVNIVTFIAVCATAVASTAVSAFLIGIDSKERSEITAFVRRKLKMKER